MIDITTATRKISGDDRRGACGPWRRILKSWDFNVDLNFLGTDEIPKCDGDDGPKTGTYLEKPTVFRYSQRCHGSLGQTFLPNSGSPRTYDEVLRSFSKVFFVQWQLSVLFRHLKKRIRSKLTLITILIATLFCTQIIYKS